MSSSFAAGRSERRPGSRSPPRATAPQDTDRRCRTRLCTRRRQLCTGPPDWNFRAICELRLATPAFGLVRASAMFALPGRREAPLRSFDRSALPRGGASARLVPDADSHTPGGASAPSCARAVSDSTWRPLARAADGARLDGADARRRGAGREPRLGRRRLRARCSPRARPRSLGSGTRVAARRRAAATPPRARRAARARRPHGERLQPAAARSTSS